MTKLLIVLLFKYYKVIFFVIKILNNFNLQGVLTRKFGKNTSAYEDLSLKKLSIVFLVLLHI